MKQQIPLPVSNAGLKELHLGMAGIACFQVDEGHGRRFECIYFASRIDCQNQGTPISEIRTDIEDEPQPWSNYPNQKCFAVRTFVLVVPVVREVNIAA